jgi:hypothetical protein
MSDIVERLRLLVPSDSSGAAFDGVNEIARLTAENEKLGRDYQSARDAHDKVLAENEKLRAALRSIAANTYGYEPDVMSDEEAKNYFSGLFFDAQNKARAALKEDRT